MMRSVTAGLILLAGLFGGSAQAQMVPNTAAADRTPVSREGDPPTRLPPAYPMPYLRPTEAAVKSAMDRVLTFIEGDTPTGLVNGSGQAVAIGGVDPGSKLRPGFLLTSYEWGVNYVGALLAGEITDDARYTRYPAERINFVADVAARYRTAGGDAQATPVRNMLAPDRLDVSGAFPARCRPR